MAYAPVKYAIVPLLVVLAISVSGCMEGYRPASFSYQIWITGLSDSSADGPAEILVPMPLNNNSSLVAVQDIWFAEGHPTCKFSRASPDWKADVVETEYGPMISFKTNDPELKDIYASAGKHLTEKSAPAGYYNVDNIMNDPFNPAFNKTSFDYMDCYYRQYEKPGEPPDFSSLVFISKNIRPKDGKNGTITVGFHLIVTEDDYGHIGMHHTVYSITNITADERGMIPVNVSYHGYYSGALK